jgi:peptidyl-prolyl cis-trans isomerase A (cyclophilin A)
MARPVPSAALLLVAAGFLSLGCAGTPKTEEAPRSEPPKSEPPRTETPKTETPKSAGAMTWGERVRNGETIFATLQTTQGDMVVKLFSKDAPRTVENFVALAAGEKTWTDPRSNQKITRPLYDGTIFHRVIPGFMIQGGDPLGEGTGGPGYEFEDELQSGRGFDKACLLAMANSGPNTNGSQFFITEKATRWLNGKHTIFGEVVAGCELVAKIARVPAQSSKPKEDVVLKRVLLSTNQP